MKPNDLLRKTESLYKELNVSDMSENEILETMLRYNDLIQRPIIEYGDKAVLARPPEILEKFFMSN